MKEICSKHGQTYGKPMNRLDDNIKIDLRKIGYDADKIKLARNDRVQESYEHSNGCSDPWGGGGDFFSR